MYPFTKIRTVTRVVSQSLFRTKSVPEVASSKNKPKFHKNLRSDFRNFLLIS
ncbi:hypothetical protein HMPREF1345_00019 [Enterococcus faecium TX1337RF]|nr:hypothetical protein HMPREF1345_00019 [Enterococcus faecium TX1337RF]